MLFRSLFSSTRPGDCQQARGVGVEVGAGVDVGAGVSVRVGVSEWVEVGVMGSSVGGIAGAVGDGLMGRGAEAGVRPWQANKQAGMSQITSRVNRGKRGRGLPFKLPEKNKRFGIGLLTGKYNRFKLHRRRGSPAARQRIRQERVCLWRFQYYITEAEASAPRQRT